MVLLVLTVVTVAVLAFPAPGPTSIDSLVTGLVRSLPGLFGWFWEISYDLLLVWTLVLVALALLARGRKRLLFEELLAGALAFGVALLAGRLAGTDWADSLRAMAASGSPPVYVAVRLAVATAVVVMASPYLARPLRYVGRAVVGVGALAAIALETAFPIGMVAAFAVGIGSAAIVHLLFGSPAGRLTLDQVADALADLGVEASGLRQAPLEPRGVAIATAEAPDGRSLLVKVYGRDAWDGQLLAAAWTALWYRGDTPHLALGRRQQVEHEAFVTLLAERAGVAVLPVVAAGMASEQDALLVTEATGRPLRPARIPASSTTSSWTASGATLGGSMPWGSRIDGWTPPGSWSGPTGHPPSGTSGARGWPPTTPTSPPTAPRSWSRPRWRRGRNAPRRPRWPRWGPTPSPRCCRCCSRRRSSARPATRSATRTGTWRTCARPAPNAAGVELPKLAQLRRVSLRSVGVVVLIGLVAYAIISALANVGLANLIDEFKAADLAWLAVALALSPVVPMAKGLRHPRGLVPAPAVRARPHARVRHPVHRPGRAQLGRQARPRHPLLRTQRHRRRRRDLHQRDRPASAGSSSRSCSSW